MADACVGWLADSLWACLLLSRPATGRVLCCVHLLFIKVACRWRLPPYGSWCSSARTACVTHPVACQDGMCTRLVKGCYKRTNHDTSREVHRDWRHNPRGCNNPQKSTHPPTHASQTPSYDAETEQERWALQRLLLVHHHTTHNALPSCDTAQNTTTGGGQAAGGPNHHHQPHVLQTAAADSKWVQHRPKVHTHTAWPCAAATAADSCGNRKRQPVLAQHTAAPLAAAGAAVVGLGSRPGNQCCSHINQNLWWWWWNACTVQRSAGKRQRGKGQNLSACFGVCSGCSWASHGCAHDSSCNVFDRQTSKACCSQRPECSPTSLHPSISNRNRHITHHTHLPRSDPTKTQNACLPVYLLAGSTSSRPKLFVATPA